MPELPEVEILARHLRPRLQGRRIREVEVRRPGSLRETDPREFRRRLAGARFEGLTRRGKYLLFEMGGPKKAPGFRMLGHLGMSGRMYVEPWSVPLAKHAVVVLGLGRERFVFEDTRYFGRMTLDPASLDSLGPEPLGPEFTVDRLGLGLGNSRQAIKVRLMDQGLVAGIGNIYASEALHRARVSPRKMARRLTRTETGRLHTAIREVLAEAIECGSTLPLDYSGKAGGGGLFYFGSGEGNYEERLRVYDREGEPCERCGTSIRKIVQAARSTFFCPACQRA